jgi:hypothetical protein
MHSYRELVDLLRSPNRNKRYEACEELRVSLSIPPYAIEALLAATRDSDPEVADAASRALRLHQPSTGPIEAPSSERAPSDSVEHPPVAAPQTASYSPYPPDAHGSPQPNLQAPLPNSQEYVFALEKRLIALEFELKQLEESAASSTRRINDTISRIPDSALISPNFLSRAFTVWGHYFVAQLLIAIPIYILFALLIGLSLWGGR